MNRIEKTFNRLRAENRTALVAYLTAGDPEPARTVDLMHTLTAAGVDLIELGVPFSDPMADGPVIQRASERALEHGMDLAGILEIAARFRADDGETPLVLMGYMNPFDRMGFTAFANSARDQGVDGVLVVDLPPEEGVEINATLRGAGLDQIYLISPTTDDERMRHIVECASGFVYCVALKGVTGAEGMETASLEHAVSYIHSQTELPVGIGFGISDADSASRVAAISDAVIVGSAIVRIIEEHGADPQALNDALTSFIGELRRAIDHTPVAAAV
ncbi:MAG: tryptophan synthase subunit alpha [Gammaproteobacteria bacterium]|nr:tryptophan synthase subunit alpha [Gammaproteobacteria bacterium]